jgi:hypothetical protein
MTRWLLLLVWVGPALPIIADGQAEYRNLDAGFPVRVEDATVTERYALDLDLANIRFDALSAGRKRFQLEPRLSYGILPRTEMWLRATTYYREREITPRKGIAGVGVGGMYQLALEGLHLPAFAIASEAFVPTGPNASPASYSVKTAFTKSFTPGRIHFNASLASYASRLPSIVCPFPEAQRAARAGRSRSCLHSMVPAKWHRLPPARLPRSALRHKRRPYQRTQLHRRIRAN